MDVTVVWFRRDLRLADYSALGRAAGAGSVLPLVVLEPDLLRGETRRRDRYLASVAALRDATGGALEIRTGDPAVEVMSAARRVGARQGACQRGDHAVRAATRSAGARGAGRGGLEVDHDRQPVRHRTGHGAQRQRRPVPQVHPVLPGLAGARLARPGTGARPDLALLRPQDRSPGPARPGRVQRRRRPGPGPLAALRRGPDRSVRG